VASLRVEHLGLELRNDVLAFEHLGELLRLDAATLDHALQTSDLIRNELLALGDDLLHGVHVPFDGPTQNVNDGVSPARTVECATLHIGNVRRKENDGTYEDSLWSLSLEDSVSASFRH